MRILAFSDLHCDLEQANRLTELSAEADVVIGAGDFASIHEGLEVTIGALAGITTPTVLVCGNNESLGDLQEAATAWPAATVLHGNSTEIEGQTFFGLGGGIPTTPWSWSYDLDETEAEAALADLTGDAVLVVHSPPKNHCDLAGGGLHLGSTAIAAAIERAQPKLAVCGHIHESWGERSNIGAAEIANLGPNGTWFDL
ncbi:MAG TPA: metallophosphoesterase family protein [Solirubrobacterales bacterium]|nr:metallophosphoesterase family protein [Solirubrobacterales bacterium]